MKNCYVHTKTGNEYFVTGECRVKINGEWKEGVEYTSPNTPLKFVREKEEFYSKFELLEHPKERHVFNQLKSRNISVLDVYNMLKEIGVEIHQRTVQKYIDNNLDSCKMPIVEEVINTMIGNYDQTLESLKQRA